LARRDSAFGEFKAPLGWFAGAAVVAVVLVAVILLVRDRREENPNGAFPTVRRAADSIAAPMGSALSAPVNWAGQVSNSVGDYLFAASQNRDLKREVTADQSWKYEVAALRVENARLRSLLGVRTDPPMPMVFARSVLDARGPFANTRVADAGAASGVTEGNPALSEHGLIGRVIGVGAGTSRIMLLTDVESRTPVLISRNNGRAILVGDGGPNPRLDFIRSSDNLRPGDRVLTSGDGGVLPRGLPVGAAVLGVDGQWRVALDSDSAPIDDVRILLFKDISQITGRGELAPNALPGVTTGPPLAPPPTLRASPPKTQPPPAENAQTGRRP